MKISFENLHKFHEHLLKYYSKDGYNKIFLEPFNNCGFIVHKITENEQGKIVRHSITSWQQNTNNKDLQRWVEDLNE